jgi:hypothetical protein
MRIFLKASDEFGADQVVRAVDVLRRENIATVACETIDTGGYAVGILLVNDAHGPDALEELEQAGFVFCV